MLARIVYHYKSETVQKVLKFIKRTLGVSGFKRSILRSDMKVTKNPQNVDYIRFMQFGELHISHPIDINDSKFPLIKFFFLAFS